MPRKLLVATHGHCFDGMASAALFVHLLRALRGKSAPELRYKSFGYGPGLRMIPEAWLDGDENAILDFRYTPSDRVNWYFDHHVTAFGSDAERDAAIAGALPADDPADGRHVLAERRLRHKIAIPVADRGPSCEGALPERPAPKSKTEFDVHRHSTGTLCNARAASTIEPEIDG
ncbi:MAG: hypothetical protein ACOYKK_08380 [Microbacteriaceae bacterium]